MQAATTRLWRSPRERRRIKPPPPIKPEKSRDYIQEDVTADRSPSPLTPEKQLFLAVVWDALRILDHGPGVPGSAWREDYQSTVNWLLGKVRSAPLCSFSEICDILDLGEPDELRVEIFKAYGVRRYNRGRVRPTRYLRSVRNAIVT